MTKPKKLVLVFLVSAGMLSFQGCGSIFDIVAEKNEEEPNQDFDQNKEENKTPTDENQNEIEDDKSIIERNYKIKTEGRLKEVLTAICKNNLTGKNLEKIEIVKFFENGEIILKAHSSEDEINTYDLISISIGRDFGGVTTYKEFKNVMDTVKIETSTVLGCETSLYNKIAYVYYKAVEDSVIERTHQPRENLLNISNFYYSADGNYHARVMFIDNNEIKHYDIDIDGEVVEKDYYLESCADAFVSRNNSLIYQVNTETKDSIFNFKGEEFKFSFKVEQEKSLLKSGIDLNKNKKTGLYEINF